MRGILFKPDMHQAIRDGRKTQTRRVIKPQPPDDARLIDACGVQSLEIDGDLHELPKPRYRIGIVYIKEAWATESQFDHLKPRDIPHSAKIFYVADGVGEWPINLPIGKRRFPLFMPTWAARDFLKITDVRPERLHQITLEDCWDEGIRTEPGHDRIEAYHRLWDSINPKFPWVSNPWVWRYEFEITPRPKEVDNANL